MVKTLLSELKSYKIFAILTPLMMIGEVLCEMAVPRLMGFIVDRGIYAGNMGYILRTGSMMLAVALVGFLFGCGGAFFGSRASTGLAKNLREAMFDRIQTFSFANIDRFSASSLVTRLTTDVANIQNAFMMMLRMAMRAPGSMIIAMVMSFTISPRLSLIYLAALLFLAGVMVFVQRRAMRYFRQVFERYDDLNESVRENVAAIRVVKSFVREDYEISRFRRAAESIYRMFVKAEQNIAFVMPLMMTVIYTCILLISWFGAHMVVQTTLTTGDLMSLLTYCMNILMSMMMVAMIFVMLSMSQASMRRIAEVLNEEPTLKNPAQPVIQVKDGSIDFEDVDFAYDPDAGEPVLRDITLHIHSGESVGIIGATGSAKSSLVNLVSRLYDVTKGSLKVGGVDVRDYDMAVLRNEVAVVLQNNILFSGTIAENLRWGKEDATDEECARAARLACADEFIARMPDGYETRIEQGGTNVSGGQRQRLCIARALMKHPKILILDDSTSACDTATDAKIRRAFREEIPEVTKLIIAQRITSVMDLDRIIVMENGRVNGFGTHDELLRDNAIYREVYESQTLGNADFDEGEADG